MAEPKDVTRWWKKPRRQGDQGDLALVKGTDTKIMCPKCKTYPVVYNGNYFCDNYTPLGYQAVKGDCDWALAHPARSKRDRAVCDLIGTDYS